MTRHIIRWGSLVGLILLVSCARSPKPPRCAAPQDNPAHHFVLAMDYLDEAQLDKARSKLERALFCDENYAPAHAGQALLFAMQAADQTDADYRQSDAKRAMESLAKAKKQSDTPEELFIYHTTAIRVLTVLQGEGWLKQSENHLHQSQKLKVDESLLLYYQGREAALYFMGVAYFRGAHNFNRARELFRQVLDAKRDSRWHAKADAAWHQADKVARATAGITLGDVGRQIAIQDQVSRGDLAALLVDELKVEQLFAGRVPVKSQVEQQQPSFTPADVMQHPFKQEILILMKWRLRGLEPQFDRTSQAYLFLPQDPVSRKVLAIVLEDILIKLTNDETLASAFLGQGTSPFPDVQPTAAWFNAVMTAVTRNLMETELSGEFRPEEPADGAEVLLAVRVLKQRLNLN